MTSLAPASAISICIREYLHPLLDDITLRLHIKSRGARGAGGGGAQTNKGEHHFLVLFSGV